MTAMGTIQMRNQLAAMYNSDKWRDRVYNMSDREVRDAWHRKEMQKFEEDERQKVDDVQLDLFHKESQ